MELRTDFEGENALQYNALITAIHECGYDYAQKGKKEVAMRSNTDGYTWIEKRNYKVLVTELVDKLNSLGFELVKK